MHDYLHTPVVPFAVEATDDVAAALRKLAGTSFQGRNLGRALDIWLRMLADDTTIFFGLAGAMVPAGMRKVIAYLIENRYIDVLVSTGANLFHDLFEVLGHPHYQGSPNADDAALHRAGVLRFHDVFASDNDFDVADDYATAFASSLDEGQLYTTRQFFYLLGQKLAADAREDGILTTAARCGVPIHCPAFGDSAYGMDVARARARDGKRIVFDTIADVLETARIALATADRSAATGVVYVGGGTPKNFIQQTEVAGYIFGRELGGHRYAIQITTDAPHWGGLSGCTFEEAVSWGKIAPEARMTTVNADATIALPLLATALAASGAELAQKRRRPTFALDGDSVLP